jgi:ketosteroid isomerase-like protein
VLALYADDAIVIWPGAGDEAKGKAELEKLVRSFLARGRDAVLTPKSLTAIPLDADHVADVGIWDDALTTPDGKRVTTRIRTVEILVRRDGRWLYLVDHASVGVPPPSKAPSRRRRRRERGAR